eukprot:PhF_6_TR10029/c0_g1_i2/m.15369
MSDKVSQRTSEFVVEDDDNDDFDLGETPRTAKSATSASASTVAQTPRIMTGTVITITITGSRMTEVEVHYPANNPAPIQPNGTRDDAETFTIQYQPDKNEVAFSSLSSPATTKVDFRKLMGKNSDVVVGDDLVLDVLFAMGVTDSFTIASPGSMIPDDVEPFDDFFFENRWWCWGQYGTHAWFGV